MALYAFDGTWNEDEDIPNMSTNVVKFRDIYNNHAPIEYREGVGTRFGKLGHILGGLFGAGGHSRIEEMYDALKDNWQRGDHEIDVIGFSRGAALAVHFTNVLAKEGLKLKDGTIIHPEIRFLGLWDIVGSFGFPKDLIIKFQHINMGWNIREVPGIVKHCFHAMAFDERRETFQVTRLMLMESQSTRLDEMWFRGMHSDIGGGNGNDARSNIALCWMLENAVKSGLPITQLEIDELKPVINSKSRFYQNNDPQRDERRPVYPGDKLHSTASPLALENIGDTYTFPVYAEDPYNWSGVALKEGHKYRFDIPGEQKWDDGGISCGCEGWQSEELPLYKESVVKHFEQERRVPEANWFELIGSLGDEDDHLFRIGSGGTANEYSAEQDAELYLFANDLKKKYGNNKGNLSVSITRVA